jgi:hypothetical protein
MAGSVCGLNVYDGVTNYGAASVGNRHQQARGIDQPKQTEI